MVKLILLEVIPFGLPLGEMDEIVAKFIESGHQAGKIHLAGHLEIEEVTVNVDTAHHQVIVEDGGIKSIHIVGATAVAVNSIVDMERTFKVVKIKARQVGHDMGADFRNAVFFHQFEGTQVGMTDGRLKVEFGVFLVPKVDEAVEVEVKVFVVNREDTVEPIIAHLAVEHNLVD